MEATITYTRPIDPRTHKQPARKMDPAELLSKINTRIRSLEAINRRGDDRDNVFAALREGRPVIPVKSFKMNGTYPPVGAEWHPGYEYISVLAQIMDQPGYKRLVVTKEHYEASKELVRLRDVQQELTPLVAKSSGYRDMAYRERAAQEAARLAEIAAKARAEQAEENLKTADAELKKYVSGITFDI